MTAPGRFSPGQFPLCGTRLIEASAGTGKTYNIANLYLRLVVGLAGDLDPHGRGEPLGVEKILVVTFTRAAAAELRGRIRALLELAYRDFRTGGSEHPFVAELLDRLAGDDEQRSLATQRLYAALLRMDEASISTIHSFALRISRELLFETGMLSDAQIVIGSNDKFDRVSADLRRELLRGEIGLPPDALDALNLGNPEKFSKQFSRLKPRQRVLPEVAAPAARQAGGITPAFEALRDELQATLRNDHARLGQQWQALLAAGGKEALEADISTLLDAIPLEAAKKEVISGPTLVTKLNKLFETADPQLDQLRGKSFPIQRLRSLVQAPEEWAKTDKQRTLAAFLIDAWNFDQAGPNSAEIDRTALRAAVALALQARLAELDLAELHLDELIELVLARLQPGSEPGLQQQADDLRSAIQEAFPVCLVDEFQDTDPAQFMMFQAIYGQPGNAGGVGFFMIGDPKQSIYAFRGADIFAYLNVRRQIGAQQAENPDARAIFSLDTNFRSKAALVAATNALFAESADGRDKSFVFEGIDYQPVLSAEQPPVCRDQGRLTSDNENPPPLQFIGNPDSPGKGAKLDKQSLLRRYARDAAARISTLLTGPARARIERGGDSRPLKPGDIAVLVRTAQEAGAMRAALARPEIGLRSVYLSQRDSVISGSQLAGDLYHVLKAINEPADQRRLKTALATPLMRGMAFDFSEMDRLDSDEQVLEDLVVEFTACRQAWLDHGVLTALERLLDNPLRDLAGKIAAGADSDRLLTDLRHLGDLLQQQDLDCDSPEQLIDWFARQLEDDSALDEDRKRIRLESDEDLVKLVTIHVAKGLEYPVVFLPFFFLPWSFNAKEQLPFYHQQHGDGFHAVIDFAGQAGAVAQAVQREQLAEDLRLLYVAVTRAIYHCCIGVSAATSHSKAVFQQTVWAHLLNLPDPSPGWGEIHAALVAKLGSDNPAVGYARLGEAAPVRFQPSAEGADATVPLRRPRHVQAPASSWQVTSYSRLARDKRVSLEGKDDDDEAFSAAETEAELARQDDDRRWQDDIRQTLRGGVLTGDALHAIFERHAEDLKEDFPTLVRSELQKRGLDKPYRPREMSEPDYQRRLQEYEPAIVNWLQDCLAQPLEVDGQVACPSLRVLFEGRLARPEIGFDFRLGGPDEAHFETINQALVAAGLEPLGRSGAISGLMNGAIDLTFEHDGRVYIADYKSNKLGPAPRHYDATHMSAAMRASRYDLQYLIYTVAAHRYLGSRLGSRYAYDDGEVSFGGVFYLFLRGMGLQGDRAFTEHGLWFTRPPLEQVLALDRALAGVQA